MTQCNGHTTIVSFAYGKHEVSMSSPCTNTAQNEDQFPSVRLNLDPLVFDKHDVCNILRNYKDKKVRKGNSIKKSRRGP